MKAALSAFLIAVPGLPATAERNLVPTIGSTPDVCTDRPAEPDWMQNIGVRDAYQRVLVQDIYRAQNLERIVDSDSCACDIRYPPWEMAESKFRESFATAERWEMLEASDTYNRRASVLRPAAKAICEAEGSW